MNEFVWACRQCTNNPNQAITLAGSAQHCQLGGQDCKIYAYSRYRKTPNGWELKTMGDLPEGVYYMRDMVE